MPVFLKIDPNGATQVLGALIPDATPTQDGVMTKVQAQQLANLVNGGGSAAMKWTVQPTQVAGDTFNASANDFVPCNAVGGPPQTGVVLPTAVGIKGKMVEVKDVGGGNSAPDIKITTTDGQTIDGQAVPFGLTLDQITGGNNFSGVVFLSNGSDWLIAYYYLGTP
jgi:hypothetical protein